MSFQQRYRDALAFKDLDVEEAIDRRFHRPLAAALTAVALSTPVTPNQITLASLLAGWAGSFFLYQAYFGEMFGNLLGEIPGAPWTRPVLLLLAGFCLFASVILDCADGQLARARGGGSRVGRILDGFVDSLVLVPAYVLIGMAVLEEFGLTWFIITAIAGFSTWARTIVYDNIRGRFIAGTSTHADASAGIETRADVLADYEKARQSGSLLERFLLRLYLGFLTVRDRLAPGSGDAEPVVYTHEQTVAYRQKHRRTMHLAALLGLGTHMLLIYTSVAAAALHPGALIVVQAILAFGFTPLLLLVLLKARTM